MAILYMMIGIPGSGKSTYAKNNIREAKIISTDAIREELYGDSNIQGDGYRIFSIAFDRMYNLLNKGENVVFDAMNLKRRDRKNVMKKAPEGTKFIAVFLDTPLDESVKRNNKRSRNVPEDIISDKQKRLQPPHIEEGFSEIIRIKDGQ